MTHHDPIGLCIRARISRWALGGRCVVVAVEERRAERPADHQDGGKGGSSRDMLQRVPWGPAGPGGDAPASNRPRTQTFRR